MALALKIHAQPCVVKVTWMTNLYAKTMCQVCPFLVTFQSERSAAYIILLGRFSSLGLLDSSIKAIEENYVTFDISWC